jgi:glycerophosphoryl diester phosphodiesterase
MGLRWSYDTEIRNWLPQLQAHRGYWVRGVPQNTLASVQKAHELAYEIAEFDVRLTADGVVILFHDDHIENTPIRSLTLLELRSRTTVSTLDELLKWFVDAGDFKLNIEIKSREILSYELEKKVCQLIRKYGVEKRVLISSFNPLTLSKVRLFCPRVYRALLLSYEQDHGNNLFVMSGVANILCAPHMLNLRSQDYLIYREHFKKINQHIPVTLWTVNEAQVYAPLKGEIHGIISDRITPAEFQRI